MNQNENKSFKNYEEQEFKLSKISNQTLCCILAYIYIFWIIGLLIDKNNKLVRFHVNQGIILFTISFFSLLVINLLSNILYSIAPILASFSALFEILWLLFFLIYVVIGIKNALNHQQKPLPIIGTLFNFLN